jgi:hypothetical protein
VENLGGLNIVVHTKGREESRFAEEVWVLAPATFPHFRRLYYGYED